MDLTTFNSFLKSGIHHVLMGWDHLLFAAALILAIRGFWEVFKIIGVFTIAHSITVTITALRGKPLLPASRRASSLWRWKISYGRTARSVRSV
jgi:HupE / UreJ protein